MDKESWVWECRHRWLGMSYNGSTTDHSNPFSERTILNKCHSYILDYLYTRSVLLSESSVLFVRLIWTVTFVNFVSFSFLNIVIIRETRIFRDFENKLIDQNLWFSSIIFYSTLLSNSVNCLSDSIYGIEPKNNVFNIRIADLFFF